MTDILGTNGYKPLYIFDIDGTLTLTDHRNPILATDDPDKWDKFYAACVGDRPHTPVISILEALYAAGSEIWFFTGRSAVVREETIQWFLTHTGIPEEVLRSAALTMRDDKDHTEDYKLKQMWYDNMFDVDKARLVCVFEDRKRVVDMWRSIGVPAIHVAPGEF